MSQRSPEPLTGFQGVLLLHVREGKIGRKEREWMGNRRKGEGREGKEMREDELRHGFGGIDASDRLTPL